MSGPADVSTASRTEESIAMGEPSLWSLFLSFFRIGVTAFGGFMALISVVQTEIVERRKLLTHAEMLDGISLATILPGPVAVNVVAYVGYKLRGGAGALVSAGSVILPGFIFMVTLSAVYFRWGQIPAASKLFLGFIPAVTAIIVHAAWGMARKALLGLPEVIFAVVACLLLLLKGGFYITLIIIVGAGVVGWLAFAGLASVLSPKAPRDSANPLAAKGKGTRLLSLGAPLAAAPLLALDAGLALKLFVTFAGMSVLLFGGGFVFIPLIQHIVVQEHPWLVQQEFVDAIALTQMTPGPILNIAAFIGYKVMGLIGAAIATVGIFLPPALLMLVSAHFLARTRNSPHVKAVLRGIRPAVVGMIAAAAWSIGSTAAPNWQSAVIFLAALTVLLRLRVNVVWIIPSAGLAGLLLY
jgi:chromate transporter